MVRRGLSMFPRCETREQRERVWGGVCSVCAVSAVLLRLIPPLRKRIQVRVTLLKKIETEKKRRGKREKEKRASSPSCSSSSPSFQLDFSPLASSLHASQKEGVPGHVKRDLFSLLSCSLAAARFSPAYPQPCPKELIHLASRLGPTLNPPPHSFAASIPPRGPLHGTLSIRTLLMNPRLHRSTPGAARRPSL